MTVLLSTANGTSVIVENIFEARFKHIDEIRRMGAKVTIDDRIAVVNGVDRLTGAPVKATDLRAGHLLRIVSSVIAYISTHPLVGRLSKYFASSSLITKALSLIHI